MVAMETERRQTDQSMWDVTDVARHLKVSEAAVRAWVLNDQIPYHKVGRLVRFHRDEIEAWVKTHRDDKSDESERASA